MGFRDLDGSPEPLPFRLELFADLRHVFRVPLGDSFGHLRVHDLRALGGFEFFEEQGVTGRLASVIARNIDVDRLDQLAHRELLELNRMRGGAYSPDCWNVKGEKKRPVRCIQFVTGVSNCPNGPCVNVPGCAVPEGRSPS